MLNPPGLSGEPSNPTSRIKEYGSPAFYFMPITIQDVKLAILGHIAYT